MILQGKGNLIHKYKEKQKKYFFTNQRNASSVLKIFTQNAIINHYNEPNYIIAKDEMTVGYLFFYRGWKGTIQSVQDQT